jgi:signal transduction histidine kinase
LERARLRNEVWTYRATGDPGIQTLFSEDIQGLRTHASELLRLTADNPNQQRILNSLAAMMDEQSQALERAMRESTTAATSGLAGNLPLDALLPEKLRQAFEALESNERQLLATRSAALQSNLRQSRFILVLAAFLAFTVLGMAGILIRREIVARTEIERGLHTAQELLGMKYEEQGVELRQVLSDLYAQIRARQSAEEELRVANEELENRVAQRTAELQHTNQELEAFTYSVSHDLRAPLRHMDGFSKILQNEYRQDLPTEAQHYLDRVRNASAHMTALVEDLLSFSRLGRQAAQKKRIPLGVLVQEARNELAGDDRVPAIDWKIAELPVVEGDPALLRQVLINLLSNAVKFTRDTTRPEIEIGSRQEGEDTVVYVRDNGAGFDPRYADKLFGVFQRLHRQDEFPGTGIGLAMVQRIIHKHNGRVWADSRIGHGATFYFSLPNAKEEEQKAVKAIGATA